MPGPYLECDGPDGLLFDRFSGPSSSVASGRSTPTPGHNPIAPTNDSVISLLQPPPRISHRYSQISLGQASLGGSFTTTLNRLSAPQDYSGRASTVVRFHERDDVEQWKGLKRYVYRLAPFLILLDGALYLLYLGLRLYCNIDVQKKTKIDAGPAWVFIAVELAITIPYLLNNFWAMFALKKRNRPRLRLVGDDVPTVDVLVTCCREDDEIIMDTVRAACDQDYPMDRFRVIILDDGASETLEEMAREASKMFPNLHYMARQKTPGVPHHFKAGNLNYGLGQGRLFPEGASEFVAALDADMVSSEPTSYPALGWATHTHQKQTWKLTDGSH
jgi:hypothetical protein